MGIYIPELHRHRPEIKELEELQGEQVTLSETPEGNWIASKSMSWWFTVAGFPGCSRLMISYNSVVRNPGCGLGQKLHKWRIAVAKKLGFTYMLATVNSDNAPQVHIMHKYGWQQLASFKNDNHIVLLFGKDLSDNGNQPG